MEIALQNTSFIFQVKSIMADLDKHVSIKICIHPYVLGRARLFASCIKTGEKYIKEDEIIYTYFFADACNTLHVATVWCHHKQHFFLSELSLLQQSFVLG